MFAQLGVMYGWKPEYLLDHLTLEEIFLFYNKGVEFEEYKAALIIDKLDEAFGGKKGKGKKQQAPPPKRPGSDKPDKKAFYKHYGDKIKRPHESQKEASKMVGEAKELATGLRREVKGGES